MDYFNTILPQIGNIEVEYSCNVCQKYFTDSILYQNHKLNCKNLISLQDLSTDKLVIEYSCDFCNRNFQDIPGYERHKCNLSNFNKFENIEENVELECICEDCHELFTNHKEYKEHKFTNCKSVKKEGIYCYNYSCTECEIKFKTKSSLASHIRFHLLKPYKCNQCWKEFRLKSELRTHSCCHSKIQRKRSIVCHFCNFSTTLRKNMLKHYEQKHGVELEEEIIRFKNFNLFELWKNALERETNTKFIQKSHVLPFESNYEKIKYICFKDCKIKKKLTLLPHYSTANDHPCEIEENAISTYCCCTAQIKVIITDESIIGKYISNHVGHNSEIKSITLLETERNFVAEKIKQKICYYKILDEIRESISDDCLKQIHLLTMNDLKNIAINFNLLENKKKRFTFK